MLSHCFLECHEMFQRLVLFLSLNVDGVFLHTTKKNFAYNCVFILFFTFCSFASQFYFFVVFLVLFCVLQNKVQFGFTVAFF